MTYIDFHCHLDDDKFKDQWRGIIDDSFNAGFSYIVSVADPYEESSVTTTIKISSYRENIFSMIAAHPHKADFYSKEVEKRVIHFLKQEKNIALGEAGLDFFYNFSSPENQKKVFSRQIDIAREYQFPLVIHSRESEWEVLSLLEEKKFSYPVIFHCFTGDENSAKEILQRGYYISFSGIVTFKKSQYLKDIAKSVPLDRIFTETDSPYLAPEPFRGKKNSPLLVKYVADYIAGLKGVSVEELNKNIKSNFKKLFLN